MNKTMMRVPIYQFCLLAIGLFVALDANAAIDNESLLENVLNTFVNTASSWAGVIEAAATRLFLILATISMVWTFGMMALRKADIAEFFAEFVRFIIFAGFFWWLLINGPAMARSIIESLMELGGSAAALGGFAGTFRPNNILDIGFIIFGRTLVDSNVFSPVDSAIGILLGLIVLILTALIAINMLLLLISAWVLSYAGIIFLGFGGSRWTSDMAINYYKTVLGIAVQIMVMVLLIGIGVSLVEDYYNRMEQGVELIEMAVVAIVALTIFVLSNKLPHMVSGIITGASIGGAGIGQLGAGAVVGAVGAAAAAATVTGAMLGAAAAQAAGGVSALKAAFSQANANVASGSDILSPFSGGGPNDDSARGQSASSGSSAFAEASRQTASSRGNSSHSPTRSGNPSLVDRATRVGVDAAANLAKGSYNLFSENVAKNTVGGRLASAIHERGAKQAEPSFEGDTLSGADSRKVDRAEEVAAFVNRGRS